jgi:methionine-rich copper-binding protein CopC
VPADGATVAAAPGAIDLEFHGDVRLIRLAPSQEGSAVVASFTPASAPAARYSVPVQGLRSGIVTVAWAAIGEDGHTVTGSFTFTIAPGGPEIAAP